ncbi:hypothetical protein Q7P37_008226 [Cladosporium fusiforme]
MTPQTMKAVKIVSPGKAEVQTVPVPRLRDNYILVKVKSVAINPTDWKHVEYGQMGVPGLTVGCDFSGTVVTLGPGCTKDYKPGDLIAGVTHGSNTSEPEDGCFGEYCMVKEGATYKVPDRLSADQAATTGVAIVTIALGLYQKLALPLPESQKGESDEWIFVYGGSTAMGTMAIQCARLSGYKVVTTCSPRNFDFVKSLGAQEAFDYNDPDCGKKIRELTNDRLTRVFDCISEGVSPEISCAAVSSSGGKIAYLLAPTHSRTDVENTHVFGYTAIGEPFTKFGKDFPAQPEDYKIASEFADVAAKLYAEGKLLPHPPKVGAGGLEGVLEGMKTLKEGKVSGFKLVYRVDESS